MSPGRATPEQVLTAVQVELALIVKRLIACRNRIYRDTGTYPDDLGAALQRAEFLLHDILAGLITPAAAKTQEPAPGPGPLQTAEHPVRSQKAGSANPEVSPRGARPCPQSGPL